MVVIVLNINSGLKCSYDRASKTIATEWDLRNMHPLTPAQLFR